MMKKRIFRKITVIALAAAMLVISLCGTSFAATAVTLNQNGGSGGTTSITPTIGEAMPAITKPTRAGYRFDGYYATINTGISVATAPGAAYGFTINSNGYYESTNKGVDYSVAVARVTITVPNDTNVTVQVINSGEGKDYDYGTIGKVDQTLGTSPDPFRLDMKYWWRPSISTSAQTNTITVPAGTHFIDFKYKKDEAASDGNDSLQFKITTSIPSSSQNVFFYDANGNSAHTWFECGSTLTAAWTLMQYTVTLDRQGGSGGSGSVTATNGSAMPSATMPTRSGYIFGGYYTQTNGGGTKYYNADGTSARNCDFTTNTTLYAQWTEKTATITYNANGHGTAPEDGYMWYSQKANAAPAISTTGYAFNSWNTKADGTGTRYNAGAQIKAANVEPAPTTLFAQWTEHTATLSYNANGHGTAPASVTMKYTGSTNAASAMSATGYTFMGWCTNASGTGTVYAAGEQVKAANVDPVATTLYAQWHANSYPIAYMDQNGLEFSGTHTEGFPEEHTYDTATALSTASKTGYTFDGWFTEPGCSGTPVTTLGATDYTEDITLYGKWTANSYHIAFNGNGSTGGSMGSIPATYDQRCALSENKFTKAGFTFAGWSRDPDSVTPELFDRDLAINLASEDGATATLYAIWQPNRYELITFDPENDQKFTFDPYTGLLTIKGPGTVLRGNDGAPMPWDCVRDKIIDIYIEPNVDVIAYSEFFRLPNLKHIYNYSRSQVIDVTVDVEPKESVFDADEPISPPEEPTECYWFARTNTEFTKVVPDRFRHIDIEKDYGECGDNLTWYLSYDDKLVIEGYGPMFDYEEGTSPFMEYADTITEVVLPEKITSFGNYAFEGLKITKIDTPDYIAKIGEGAFKNCSELEEFKIIARTEEFGSGIFAGCKKLKSLRINEAAKARLEEGYLITSDGLLIQYMRDHVYKEPSSRLQYTYVSPTVIPAGVKEIGRYAFYDEENVVRVELPDSVEKIDEYAFYEMPLVERFTSYADRKTETSEDALFHVGANAMDKKYSIIYESDSEFEGALKKAGYAIKYQDELKVANVTARYDGDAVMIGEQFALSDVTVTILFDNGKSKNVTGLDENIYFSNRTLTAKGANSFTATYDDGFGNVLDTAPFTVNGIDSISRVVFSYVGPAVWTGTDLDERYVTATVYYASGSSESIPGTKKKENGSSYITFQSKNVEKHGANTLTAVYESDSGKTFSGTFTVQGRKYVTSMTASYPAEDTIGVADGVGGLNLSHLSVHVNYSDGTADDMDGTDGALHIDDEYSTSGNVAVFRVTAVENNRDNVEASFSVTVAADIDSVAFTYVGQALTPNSRISPTDVSVAVTYSDQKTTRTSGDMVDGFAIPDNVITQLNGSQEVAVKYEAPDRTFTGTISVPIRNRMPYKLIVNRRPSKQSYEAGDAFDPEGMEVSCMYDDGTTEDVTERITVVGGDCLTAGAKMVQLSYLDDRSGLTITTNLSINVNEYEHSESETLGFAEQYEITKIYFRSKETRDVTYTDEESLVTSTDSVRDGEWIDVTPPAGSSVLDIDDVKAITKAGYGIEFKVYTRYKTNRAGEDFNRFVTKEHWEAKYEEDPNIDESEGKWKYLNEIYPQYTPTANPDLLYLRITSGLVGEDNKSKNVTLATGENGSADFIILEKTNVAESGEAVDEGEWYSSTKIFELPERTDIVKEGEGTTTRKLYVSRDAANPNTAYTDYVVQIVSPAWYGYEPEPKYNGTKFIYIDDTTGEWPAEFRKSWQNFNSPYLHVCASFRIRVVAGDDVKTHILQ